MCFARFKEHPYHRITPGEFLETLNITRNELNFHAVYLEEKGLVELQKPLEGSVFVGARITPQGIDLCEDEYRLDAAFPVTDERTFLPDNVFLGLNELAARTQQQNLGPDDKDIILQNIEGIKDELKNDFPRFSTVKKHVDVIKGKHLPTANEVIRLLKTPPVMRVLHKSLWQ